MEALLNRNLMYRLRLKLKTSAECIFIKIIPYSILKKLIFVILMKEYFLNLKWKFLLKIIIKNLHQKLFLLMIFRILSYFHKLSKKMSMENNK